MSPPGLRLGAGPGALLATLLACGGSAPAPPPYGFGSAREQSFRLETEESTRIEGSSIHVQRYVDFRLVAEFPEPGRQEISLFLERYYLRVEGAPGGDSEIALSDRGLAVRTPGQGELHLAPGDQRPGGGPVKELLERPVAGCELAASGAIRGTSWQSFDPILSGVRLIDWVLLGFPLLEGRQVPVWGGRRRLPPLGQYQLGIDLPLHYQRVAPTLVGGESIRSTALLRRSGLRVDPELVGDLELDLRGEAQLGPAGCLRDSGLELVMHFRSGSESLVTTRSRTRIRCRNCTSGFNSTPQEPDEPGR